MLTEERDLFYMWKKTYNLHFSVDLYVFLRNEKIIHSYKNLCYYSNQEKMIKLILIRGNSGSGKTSLAKELQQQFGKVSLLISQDLVRRQMLNVRDGRDCPAIPLLINLVKYGHDNYEITILEGILYTGFYKSLFEEIARLFGDNIFAYYYDIPFEETLKRHQTKSNKDDFGESEMRDWWIEKDYIGFIAEKPIYENESLEAVAEKICSEVI